MKRILIVLCLLMAGCAGAKIECPPMPEAIMVDIYPVPGGICLDEEGADNLVLNIKNLKDYADNLKALIENHNK